MTDKKRRADSEAEDWNRRHPPHTLIVYDGQLHRTSSSAWVFSADRGRRDRGAGVAVVLLEARRAAVPVSRCRPVDALTSAVTA